MKTGKKVLSLILAVIMLISVVPMTDLGIEASATSKTRDEALAWVRSQNGKSLDVDGYPASQPYQCVDFIAKYYEYLGVSRSSGNGCDYATNTLPSGWSRVKGGSPQPGDILVYTGNTYGHVAIYEASNAIWHQNWGYSYVIKTTNKSYNSLSTKLTYWGYIRPNFSGGSSHTRNTSYGTDFSATANEKIDVFNGDHSDPGNYYIDKGDQCTIHEVYTDGCCKVTYPTSTGTRTYYAPINKFTITSNYADPIVELVYWGDNGTTTHVRPVVQIKNPETVDRVLFPTWSHNGDGAQHNLVWYDTVFNGGLCWFNDIAYDKFSYQFIESHCYVYGKNGSTQTIHLPRAYNRNFTYKVDVNMVIDGVRYDSGASGFTFDYYIDGNLVANDVTDWCNRHYCGQTYEIKDIKTRTGYVLSSGTLSGVITSDTEALLTFVQGTGVLDLNGVLDGSENGSIGNYGTADIYLNGSLVSSGCWDYCETLPAGTKYEIKNIKSVTGKQYNGVYSGSLSGTITSGVTTKVFLNFSTTGYALYFDVNHDNIRPNLYKPTKSTKTVNGVTYKYNATKDTITLNGSYTSSGGVIDSYAFKPSANSYYKITATVLSGSFSNCMLVLEAKNSSGGTVGSRIYFDIWGSSSKTWYFSSADANSTANLQTWLYCSNASNAKINNAEIQIKVEKVASSTSSATAFSPSMKGMHYNEAYPTVMTPSRSGYTFDGWYTAATGGTKITSSSKYPASNQTLYAHWTCNHSTTEVRNAKTATCTAEGYTGDTYCKTCGTKTKTGSTITKTSHNSNTTIPAVAATCTKTGLTEGKKCSFCGIVTVAQQTVAKRAHSYTSTVTTQPSCTKEGVRTYKCSCGASYTEAIAKKSHTITTVPAVAATCTKTGLTEGNKCSVCGTVTVAQQTVAKKAHSYTATVTTQPSCTKEGVRTYKCSCGASYTEAIAKKSHTITTVPAVAATCTKTGLTEGKKCSVCGTVTVAQQTVAKTTHNDANGDGKCDACNTTTGTVTPDTPEEPDNNNTNCSHMCHKNNFIWKILRFFFKLFKINKTCDCGVAHY